MNDAKAVPVRNLATVLGLEHNYELYDAVEVTGMKYDVVSETVEPAEDDEKPDYYSVLLHLRAGGTETLCDVFHEGAAINMAYGVQAALVEYHRRAKTGVSVILMHGSDDR